MIATDTPFPTFPDLDGRPLDAGYVYFGARDENPETSPVTVYWDADGTQPATQPIRTQNGYLVRNGTPALVYVASDYSMTVRNQRRQFVFYAPSSVRHSTSVTDDFTCADGQTAFTLSRDPGGAELTVILDGQVLQASDYTLSGTTLTLATAAFEGQELSVRYALTLPIGAVDASQVSYTPAGTGAGATNVQAKLREISVSITDFGGSPNASGAANSAALAAAQTELATRGGGVIDVPSGGTFILANVGPGVLGGSGATSWDNRFCFRFTEDNITLRLAPGAILKLGDGENAHVIQFGQRAGSSVSVSGCAVIGGEINGNRTNQTTPTDADNHFDGINISTGCTNCSISGVYIHDTAYYGIGVQRDGCHNLIIEHIRIENTGADGIDAKDDSDAGTGNMLRHVRVRNWGMVSTLSTGQAAVDLRSGWAAYDVDFADPGSSAALNGLRLQNGTPAATPVSPTRVHGIRGAGVSTANSVGVRVITRYASVRDGYVKAFADGYSLSDPDARFGRLIAESNETGFRLWQNAAGGVEADTATLNGLIARSNTQNGIVCDSIDEVTFSGCDVRNNTTYGYDIRSGCTNVRILGGSATGNGTDINDAGTSTIVQDVSGVRTKSAASASIAIDSTGTKTITIAHGLAFTPSVNDVRLTLKRNTNVGDWSAGFLWVVSCDATNINGQLRVLTASATGGALVDVVAFVDTKALS